ncbi:MAG: phosphatidylserine decarboxylase [Elusimicrobia bacterium]|nr:phosphatidylserine decarboxylase [Elusimicrobiota bacterium]
MRIARPGPKYMAIGVGVVFIGWVISGFAVSNAFGVLIEFLAGLFVLFCAYFFRDPERILPADPDKLYAPGDGVVLSVGSEGSGGTVLRIFLSIFDVHVQRVPCAGMVEQVERHAGSFLPAMKDDAKSNFRVELRLKPEGGREPVTVEQITGIVARRIECWVKPGDKLSTGQRYGIIHFGSQVAVRMPASAKCVVKPGDRVAGGITVVGEWTSKP